MKRFLLASIVLAFLLAFTVTAFSSRPAFAAQAHSSSCDYYEVASTNIYDSGTGTYIGSINFDINGCGGVEAFVNFYFTGSYANHVWIYNSSGTLVAAAPYPYTNVFYTTGGQCVYGVGVIQVPSHNYWGSNRAPITGCYNGY